MGKCEQRACQTSRVRTSTARMAARQFGGSSAQPEGNEKDGGLGLQHRTSFAGGGQGDATTYRDLEVLIVT
jgi:hypothetical protein